MVEESDNVASVARVQLACARSEDAVTWLEVTRSLDVSSKLVAETIVGVNVLQSLYLVDWIDRPLQLVVDPCNC